MKEVDCKYVDQKLLGAGGYGEVFQARHGRRSVAIKKFKDLNQCDMMDVMLLCHISHPFVVSVLEVLTHDECTSDETVNLVMPLATTDLYSLAKKTKLTANDKVEIMYQLADAVYGLHKAGIWHLDLKMENVLVDVLPPMVKDDPSEYTVKLTDFGLGMWTRPGTVKVVTAQRRFTRAYAPPEMQKDVGPYVVWHTSDVYVLGLMMFELWLSDFYIHRIRRFDIPFQRLLHGSHSHPNLAGMLKGMLEDDPERRATMAQVVKSSFWNGGFWHLVAPVSPPKSPAFDAWPLPFTDLWDAFLATLANYANIRVRTAFRALDLFWQLMPYLHGDGLRTDKIFVKINLELTLETLFMLASVICTDEPYDILYTQEAITFLFKVTGGRVLRSDLYDRAANLAEAATAFKHLLADPTLYPNVPFQPPSKTIRDDPAKKFSDFLKEIGD